MSSSVTHVIFALWSKRPTLLFWRLRPLPSGTLPSFSLCYSENLDSVSRDSSSWSLVSVSWSQSVLESLMSPLLLLSLLKSLHVPSAPAQCPEVLYVLSAPAESPEVTSGLLCSPWVCWSHFRDEEQDKAQDVVQCCTDPAGDEIKLLGVDGNHIPG